MSMETFLLIIGVSVIVLVIICMPVVWQVWRAVKGVNVSLGTLNENLPAILKNIEETTKNINNSTTTISNEIQVLSNGLNRFYSATSGIIGDIRNFSPQAVKGSFLNLISNGLAIIKGVSVFLRVFLDKKS
ncbi:MAG TPA: DUF948 domain-containing protein [Smithellaceae bacterium]|nr:DUF948 domain-containing protein [Smithellaceae bacterium]